MAEWQRLDNRWTGCGCVLSWSEGQMPVHREMRTCICGELHLIAHTTLSVVTTIPLTDYRTQSPRTRFTTFQRLYSARLFDTVL